MTLLAALKAEVQAFEIALIEQAMAEARYNQRKAAELLQVTYHQLRGYLKKYDILKKGSKALRRRKPVVILPPLIRIGFEIKRALDII